MVFVLSKEDSIANQYLLELRDRTIQSDRLRFRKNLERLGTLMAYEISKKLSFESRIVETPLSKWSVNVPKAQPVLITILRAGLPYYLGFQSFYDYSDVGFIGAYRKEGVGNIAIKLDYLASPSLEGKDVILIDPMLATGHSIIEAVGALSKNGAPRHVFIAALIAAPEGIKFLQDNLTNSFSLWTVAIDEKLDPNFYIVPGLGDAGDLSFGDKL
jgi:uracil phosphoribosyltransferase